MVSCVSSGPISGRSDENVIPTVGMSEHSNWINRKLKKTRKSRKVKTWHTLKPAYHFWKEAHKKKTPKPFSQRQSQFTFLSFMNRSKVFDKYCFLKSLSFDKQCSFPLISLCIVKQDTCIFISFPASLCECKMKYDARFDGSAWREPNRVNR